MKKLLPGMNELELAEYCYKSGYNQVVDWLRVLADDPNNPERSRYAKVFADSFENADIACEEFIAMLFVKTLGKGQ